MESVAKIRRDEQIKAFDRVPSRGSTDHLLQTVQQHHVQLSAMADQKASIVIGTISIMLTIIVGHIHTDGFSLSIGVTAMMLLVAAIFAFLALKPSLHPVALDAKGFNPLFFGHFVEMDQEHYVEHMARILEQDPTVYETLVRDIYQLGQVLYQRKYRFLSYSYRTFISGLTSGFLIVSAEELLRWWGL